MNLNDLRVKLKGISFNTFNKILTFLINWKKKHKILSFIICIWLVVKIVCFPLYVYRYFKYGHFEKVAVKYSNREYSSLYETKDTIQYDYDTIIEKGTMLLYIPNTDSPRVEFAGYDKFTQMKDILLYDRLIEDKTYDGIYNKFTDLVVYEASIDDFLYMYDKKHKKFVELDTKNKKFDNIINKVKPLHFVKDYPSDDIYRLDNNNLLIAKHTKISENSFKRLSIKDNKYHKIDISEVKEHYSEFIQLKDDRFLFVRASSFVGPITQTALYELKNDKFKKIDIISKPKNCTKYKFSVNNPLVLDENRVIFIGGTTMPAYLFGLPTKKCYLYDIKKGKIVRINDFPQSALFLNFLKTSDGENYIYFNNYQTDKKKQSIYRYVK